ncbi:MAG: hypothetical protein OEZ58_23655 [Gammaproteobacteria bacterium]|nr:hypothetical protein [Gammaproteobacteria bacterium]
MDPAGEVTVGVVDDVGDLFGGADECRSARSADKYRFIQIFF